MIKRNKKQTEQAQEVAPAPVPTAQPAMPVATEYHANPTLNAGQTECRVGNEILQIGNQIYFMLPTLIGVSIGKIELFSQRTMWMYVMDVQTGDKHWVSIKNWHEYKMNGAFDAETIVKPQPKTIADKPAF